MMKAQAMDLNTFGIDKITGFLPSTDPLQSLASSFGAWEDAARNLPKLLVTDRIREILKKLPQIDPAPLKTKAEIERGMMLLSYLGHGYVWGEKTIDPVLPANIAVPWHALATKLGRPPVLSYASYALWNWRRIDSSGPIACGNITLLQNFLAGIDEEWFILIHIDIEARAAKAINAIPLALSARDSADSQKMINALDEISSALIGINATMDRMPEHCDPYIYYNRVRPYIHGWKDNPALPNGLIYEGVAEYKGQPQKFRGETGAQSSIVPALDAVLGLGHEDDPLRQYLNEMRSYMPPEHNSFIKAVEAAGSVREFVKNNIAANPELKRLYNLAVHEIEKFRTTHLTYAANYINKQKQTSDSNPTGVGTGGTPFMVYLKKHRDESTKHLL
jgi:indoleamine 2,3-dioxygenase